MNCICLKDYKGLKYLAMAEPFISEKLENFEIHIVANGDPISSYEKYIINKE